MRSSLPTVASPANLSDKPDQGIPELRIGYWQLILINRNVLVRHQIELGKQSLDGAAGGVTKGLMMEALHVSGDILEGCDQWQTKRAADARADLELRMLDQAEVRSGPDWPWWQPW